MVFFIIAWSLFLIVCLPLGSFVLHLANADVFDRPGDRLITAMWLGIVVIGVMMLVTSFFFPLTPLIAAIVAGVAVVISLASLQVRVEMTNYFTLLRRWHICAYLIIVLLVAAFMTQPIVCVDSALYHIQAVKWLSQYGSVPGVALIHGRLGFTSSWFALAAPFHAGNFDARSTAIMGGVGLCWVLLHGVILSRRFIVSKANYEDGFILLAYIICVPYAIGINSAVSSSPDQPVVYLTVIVGWAILLISRRQKEKEVEPSSINSRLVPLILSAGATAVKLSAVPLLVVSLVFYLMGKGSLIRRVSYAALICGLMIIPVLVLGLITSGCAFYPASYFCLDVPWSVGPDLAVKMNSINQNYERWRQYTPLGTGSWIVSWSKLNLDSVVFLLILFFGSIAIFSAERLKEIRGRVWVIALAILGTVFIMLTIPARRFGLGYFALVPSLVSPKYPKIAYPLIFIVPLAFQADIQTRRIRFVLLVISLSVYLYMLFKDTAILQKYVPQGFIILAILFPLKAILAVDGSNVFANGRNRLFWLIPPDVRKTELEIWVDKQVNDLRYIHSIRPFPDGRCWAAELPCTPWLLDENIRLRDPKRGLGAGVMKADR